MPRATKRSLLLALFLLPLLSTGGIVRAQQPPVPPKPPEKTEQPKLRRDVDLVVLHATVTDKLGRFVPGLKAENFRVFEDSFEQKLAICRQEDIPVTMGLVVDNSGSMRDKRAKVNAAALTLVEASNPQDEAFVVNFNEDYYLDMDKDFTNSITELKEALSRIDSRGSTALFDAVIGSLDHLKKGTRDKKILLVVTDGEDNASRKTFEYTVQAAQQSNALIYTVGLLDQEDKKAARRAKRVLTTLSTATGGLAFFPKGLNEVEAICTRIAHDIRNQYLLAYYPTNTAKDGTFRAVRVQLTPPRGEGKLLVRTRTGYYAQKTAAASASD